MATIFSDSRVRVLFAAPMYPRSNALAESMGLVGGRNAEMRAMTIAAFRIAQNNTQLSQLEMNLGLLKFLMANSDSAIGHWIAKAWLSASTDFARLTVWFGGMSEFHCRNCRTIQYE